MGRHMSEEMSHSSDITSKEASDGLVLEDERPTSDLQSWHTLPLDAVYTHLSTSPTGLSNHDLPARLAEYGPNTLTPTPPIRWYHILLRQLRDTMNWIFFGLGAAGFALGDPVTGGLLCGLSVLNVYLSFSQEAAAERTLAALKALSSPTCTVLRDGMIPVVVGTEEVVPGDVLVLKAGDKVAADVRLMEVSGLLVDEALLTGEAVSVKKKVGMVKEDEALGDRVNMAYASTTVVKGRGKGVVVATGMKTEVGKIAKTLNESTKQEESTQIQKSLWKMYLGLLATSIVFGLTVLAVNKFRVPYDVGLYALTAALSVLPAGLTTVLTVTLVLGGKEMTRQRAVVRRLKCLETLGAVNIIFSDKTGTLTQARMTVVRVWVPEIGVYTISSGRIGVIKNGGTEEEEVNPHMPLEPSLERFIQCCALCNTTNVTEMLSPSDKNTIPDKKALADPTILKPLPTGSPTETALASLASTFNSSKPTLESMGWTIVHEHHFDSTLKRMSVLVRDPAGCLHVFTKGAAESVLPLCTGDGRMDENRVLDEVEGCAARGLRVMVMGWKVWKGNDEEVREEVESGLQVVGCCGIYDPPRPETKYAIQQAHQAGISVHMLTGDHLSTAITIAKEIALLPPSYNPTAGNSNTTHMTTTGPLFDALTDEEIDALPSLPLIVARCTPETKVRMIRASKRRGYISAMTGDGINDSPSLQIAHVGIAMGQSGSDVAKQSSDMILTDDNFDTIIKAIAEGRRIYRNIQRFLLYYWIGLGACALVVMGNLWIKDPQGSPVSPISTLEMVYLYIIMSPPAASLSTQPAARTLMSEPPRPATESLFNKDIVMDFGFYTFVMTCLLLGSFYTALFVEGGVQSVKCDENFDEGCRGLYRARATLLCVFSLVLMVQAIHVRSKGLQWMNKRGLKATWDDRVWMSSFVVVVTTLVVVTMVESIARVMGMAPISWEWGLVWASVLFFVLAGEVYKSVKREPREGDVIEMGV
ncbi:potassium/sodium efflux P-type ATPase, fungal-type [Spizellomyces punctatus DAOM BR117]|uniref:Potassium/sodium efflux P-type ATPase, fungal-type n=1 Tax=Spizellomyces punctatus (strain DAOM BR117) TaxID=645134 RepID=A0A0L0HE33_SPIPD|nr:potassium/sodium efflux P-type ATPase, fungal-type [Spizellomyces punctatus DAOM BR117]KNC99367.1 potassium/sodium efflux P-type ATPase, fungal-type [Spizellomyces punctatus DAOM BR117]|eukprot:XP_016607407.1 potassium/sodium efflux P-type ATPase, fungal-type [Spizellomyces punctatus DAOM BR117]